MMKEDTQPDGGLHWMMKEDQEYTEMEPGALLSGEIEQRGLLSLLSRGKEPASKGGDRPRWDSGLGLQGWRFDSRIPRFDSRISLGFSTGGGLTVALLPRVAVVPVGSPVQCSKDQGGQINVNLNCQLSCELCVAKCF